MANAGKYIDRSPNSCRVAGKPNAPLQNLADTMKDFDIREVAEFRMATSCKNRKPETRSPIIPQTSDVYEMFNNELIKSRFVAFRESFFEDMYFKRPPIGTVAELNAKPAHVTNTSFTFGMPTKSKDRLYGLVLPEKPVSQINREYAKGHQCYIKSHQHYFPAEQINRAYAGNFNQHNLFGMRTNADPTGHQMEKCLQECERFATVRKNQRKFIERTLGVLGKPRSRFYGLPADKTFGHEPLKTDCNMKSLVEQSESCAKKFDLVEIIVFFMRLRRYISSRTDFHMYDLKKAFDRYDKPITGFIKFADVMSVMNLARIPIDIDKFILSLQLYAIFRDKSLHVYTVRDEVATIKRTPEEWAQKEVDHLRLWTMLQSTNTLPERNDNWIVPENIFNKETSYRQMCDDAEKPLQPQAVDEAARRMHDTNKLYSNIKSLISPDIADSFNVDRAELETRLPREVAAFIFRRIYKADAFNKFWDETKQILNVTEDKLAINELRRRMYPFTF